MADYKISLISDLEERTVRSGKGPYLQNVIIEPRNLEEDGGELRIVKRPGLKYLGTALADSYIGFGSFYFINRFLEESTFVVKKTGGAASTWNLCTVDGTNGTISAYAEFPGSEITANIYATFQPMQYETTETPGVIADLFAVGFYNKGYIVSISSLAIDIDEITDADFPGSSRGLAFLGNYLVAAGTGGVYNSDFNDGFTWNATNFIVPQSMSNTNGIQYVANHKDHVVVFGKTSIEFLYNAGNPTGSPFSVREDAQIRNIGLYSSYPAQATAATGANYIANVDDGNRIAFISHTFDGRLGVHVLEDFQLRKISNYTIDKYLNQEWTSGDPRPMNIVPFSINGRSYICLSIRSYDTAEHYNSWVFDLDGDGWLNWTSDTSINAGGNMQIVASSPLIFTASDGVSTDDKPLGSLVQLADGKLYYLDESRYQDLNASAAAKSINVTVVTPKYRGPALAEHKRKFQRSLYVMADRYPDPGTLNVSWSDDDYVSYSTPRVYDLSNPEASEQGLGAFYERAYKLEHTDNAPLRLNRHLLTNVNIGR